MAETILVTGGAGYIGSHTVLELLKSGYNIIVVDNCTNSFMDETTNMPESLRRVEKLTDCKIKFYLANLLNQDMIRNIFQDNKIDCVIHFAARKAIGESCRIPLDYYQNNLTGIINLLKVMSEFKIYRFIFSSSAVIYGECEPLPIKEENSIGNCTNPYGNSKFFSEIILRDLCKADKKWSVISLRYFNPVGAHSSGEIGEDPIGDPSNLMAYISQVCVGRRSVLKVFGADYRTPDGTCIRDFIHVVDLATAHVKAIEKCKCGFSVYNLGTGKGTSVLELIKSFEIAANKTIKYVIVGRRPGDLSNVYADPSLANAELGWKAKLDIMEMCKDTWRWQYANPLGYTSKRGIKIS